MRLTIIGESVLGVRRYQISFLAHPVAVSSHQAWGAMHITSPHLLSAIVVGVSTVDLGKDMDADSIELEVGDMLNNFVISSKVLSKSVRSTPSLRFRDVREAFFKEGKLEVVIVPRVASVPVRKLENFSQVDVNLLECCTKCCGCGQGDLPTFI
jgi:hypothetical protein